MAQGDFTQEEAQATIEAFDEVFKALPKKKMGEFIGHANDIFLFLEACKKQCPTEVEAKAKAEAEAEVAATPT
jgi:hypothetical protein